MNEKIINGSLDLVYSNRIYFANYELMKVPVRINERNMMMLVFDIKYDDSGKEEARFEPCKENGKTGVKFILRNFGGQLGTFMKKPIEVGKVGKKPIMVTFGVIKCEDCMPILDLCVYVEREDDGQ